MNQKKKNNRFFSHVFIHSVNKYTREAEYSAILLININYSFVTNKSTG